ncbi:AAA family ATPase [Streptomyces sp. NPDC048718]|uniref:AAA family ATPase n=1 Tax=Streptomyces sp. NPDC048718 TaxID=3365587 RepID=UPI0037131964
MIVWLNGPFGGGKTTLAAGLRRALPGATVADPEAVGDLLHSTLAGHTLRPKDYQDLPLRRHLTSAFVAGLAQHTGGPVIVPMTVPDPAYAEEIFTPPRQADGGFHHLVVHTAPVVLRERIVAGREFPGDEARSEAVRAYRRRRATDYRQAATGWMHADGHVIDASALTPEQTLDAALTHLRLPAPARPPGQPGGRWAVGGGRWAVGGGRWAVGRSTTWVRNSMKRPPRSRWGERTRCAGRDRLPVRSGPPGRAGPYGGQGRRAARRAVRRVLLAGFGLPDRTMAGHVRNSRGRPIRIQTVTGVDHLHR